MGGLEVKEGKKKKKPNLNACSKSNNWDELEFIPNRTNAIMGAGSLRPSSSPYSYSNPLYSSVVMILTFFTTM